MTKDEAICKAIALCKKTQNVYSLFIVGPGRYSISEHESGDTLLTQSFLGVVDSKGLRGSKKR